MRAAESALAERASQAAPRTLLAQGRGSLQWVIHHPDSLSMMDGLIDPLPPTLRAIARNGFNSASIAKTLPQRGANGRIDHHIAERHDTNWHTTGIGAMHISITVTSLSLSTASGAD